MLDAAYASTRKIVEFTRCKTVAAQTLVLKAMRIPHVIGSFNRPIVLKAHLSDAREAEAAGVIPSCSDIRALRPMPRLGVGIYFLCQGTTVVYVGKTTNLFTRLRNHALGELEFDCVRFLPCLERKLDALEREYIARFKPKYNKTFNAAAARSSPEVSQKEES